MFSKELNKKLEKNWEKKEKLNNKLQLQVDKIFVSPP